MVRELSIVLCGAAGQGVQTVEVLLVRALGRSGFHVFSTKESMSRVRGGNNSTEIRVSEEHTEAFVDRIDLLVPLNSGLRWYPFFGQKIGFFSEMAPKNG